MPKADWRTHLGHFTTTNYIYVAFEHLTKGEVCMPEEDWRMHLVPFHRYKLALCSLIRMYAKKIAEGCIKYHFITMHYNPLAFKCLIKEKLPKKHTVLIQVFLHFNLGGWMDEIWGNQRSPNDCIVWKDVPRFIWPLKTVVMMLILTVIGRMQVSS